MAKSILLLWNSYDLGVEGSSRVVSEGVEGTSSGLADGDAGEGNSFMVTVTRLVVTSVTTTSLQPGAISGCQLGSPSAGTLPNSPGEELSSPGPTGNWRLGLRRRGLFRHSSERPERPSVHSSLSPSKEEGGDEGRKEDAKATKSASEDRVDQAPLVPWHFWVSAWGDLDLGLSPNADGCDWTLEVLGDFSSELLVLEGDGGVWYWDEVERVSLADGTVHDLAWAWKGAWPPHWSPNGFPYIGNPSILGGGWKGL